MVNSCSTLGQVKGPKPVGDNPPCKNYFDCYSDKGCPQQFFQEFYGAIELKNTWNIPACGQITIVYASNLPKISVDSYLWSSSYGYFKVLSIDSVSKKLTILNDCIFGSDLVGLQVPAYSTFIVTAAPSVVQNLTPPYLIENFKAPIVGACTTISVSSTDYFYPGAKLLFGGKTYTVQQILNSQQVLVCNEGSGFTPATDVIAFGSFNFPNYFIKLIEFGELHHSFQWSEGAIVTPPGTLTISTTITLTNPSSIKTRHYTCRLLGGVMRGFFSNAVLADYEVDVRESIDLVGIDSAGDNVFVDPVSAAGFQSVNNVFISNSVLGSESTYGNQRELLAIIKLLPNRSVVISGSYHVLLDPFANPATLSINDTAMALSRLYASLSIVGHNYSY